MSDIFRLSPARAAVWGTPRYAFKDMNRQYHDSIKALIRPVVIRDKLLRVGQQTDGAYVIPERILKQTEVCYSYGVADNVDFDLAYHRFTGNPVHLYDPTVEAPPNLPAPLKFHRQGISAVPAGAYDNYLAHLKANQDDQKQVLLKIDVEGAEYEWLLHTDLAELAKTAVCIVLEFHWIHANQKLFVQSVEKLKTRYHLVHLHCNNCVGSVAGLPEVPELTFVRRDAAAFGGPVKVKYPIPGLDYPNARGPPELTIDYRAWHFKLLSRVNRRLRTTVKKIVRR